MLTKYGTVHDLEIDIYLNKIGITRSINYLREIRDRRFQNYAETNIRKGKRKDNREFSIGSHVWVFNEQLLGKLEGKKMDGFMVVSKHNDSSYWVSDGC